MRAASLHRHVRLLLTALLAVILAACNIETTSWENYMTQAEQAYMQQRYDDAERLFNAAIMKAEVFQAPDARHALSLNQLGKLYHAQGRYGKAEPLYLR